MWIISEAKSSYIEILTMQLLPKGDHFLLVVLSYMFNFLFVISDNWSNFLKKLRGHIILVMAVPGTMNLRGFCDFCELEPASFESVKIISDGSLNRFIYLLEFVTQLEADDYYFKFNGKSYDPEKNEVCLLGYVDNVLLHDVKDKEETLDKSLVALPSCIVCLERLDASVSGLLTFVCNHSFHCDCHQRWRENNHCIVCDCIQSDYNRECLNCGTTENLWICLICGYIGCSRYKNKHSKIHYKETGHRFAFELETERIWDYIGDVYIHRFMQNIYDGQITEFSDVSLENDEKIQLAKSEALELEFDYLLHAHLESQKDFFEGKIYEVQKSSHEKVVSLETELDYMQGEQKDIDKRILEVLYERDTLKIKVQELEDKMKQIDDERNHLKSINREMKEERKVWKNQVREGEKIIHMQNRIRGEYDQKFNSKIQELTEQIRDLMFFIEAQKSLANENADNLEDGQVVVVSNVKTPRRGKGKGKGRRKR
eukprot:TRINITY_DN1441_c0_g1_i1.p1 TRINITY_DN1441_c0_g1~~TRINITY_DN1441_c0_g1_i1.p1  ORF type:complete len:485 (+),score=94.96 TRINITY_DN1441_c0_g1_i1:125-1579(+)